MLATASSQGEGSSHSSGGAPHTADESLSWQQLSLTTMSDTEYQQAMNNATPDQKIVLDKVYTHNRSLILNGSADQLLLFVTGGAGVGKRTIREMLIRNQLHHNPVLLTAPTGIAAYNIGGITAHCILLAC